MDDKSNTKYSTLASSKKGFITKAKKLEDRRLYDTKKKCNC